MGQTPALPAALFLFLSRTGGRWKLRETKLPKTAPERLVLTRTGRNAGHQEATLAFYWAHLSTPATYFVREIFTFIRGPCIQVFTSFCLGCLGLGLNKALPLPSDRELVKAKINFCAFTPKMISRLFRRC